MYCTHCGHHNPAEANFCGNCGRALEASPSEQTTGAMHLDDPGDMLGDHGVDARVAPSELQPGTALLVVVRGPNEGARYLLDSDVTTVGRHPDSGIFLDDITVSRRHAEFRRDGHRVWVHDVGSLNGTYVNGRRAENQQVVTGDEIQVGKFKLYAVVAEVAS
jgi:hypothetical protein